jgi:hypothetical protein
MSVPDLSPLLPPASFVLAAKRLEGLPPAEAARLHERMHTYANPKLQELPDTEKGGAGIEGGK